MAKEYPYYPMYPKDFDADEKVRGMCLAEKGLFIDCLNHAWTNGGLPSDPEEIQRQLKVIPDEFTRYWPRVSRCFHLDENGLLVNGRQESERKKIAWKSALARRSADKMWERKRLDATASKLQTTNGLDANAFFLHKERSARAYESVFISGKEESVREENHTNGDADFDLASWVDSLYAQHPKKNNLSLVRVACKQILDECMEKHQDPLKAFTAIYEAHAYWSGTEDWNKEHCRFCPQLANWLTDRGYTAKRPNGNGHKPKQLTYAEERAQDEVERLQFVKKGILKAKPGDDVKMRELGL